MNKRLIGTCFLAAVFTAAFSQSVCPVDLCNNKLRGKEIYIPKDLQGMDLQNLNGAIIGCAVRTMW